MKKLLLLACSVGLIISSSYAQPKKGDWMVGIRIFPQGVKGGYFLSDRLTVSAALMGSFHHVTATQETYISTNAGPSLRYYFAPRGGMQAGKFYAFADAEFLYAIAWTNTTPLKKDQYSHNIRGGLAPGLTYLINDRVSGEAALRFNYIATNDARNNNISTAFEAGFNVYLKGRKKKTSDVAEMRGS